MKMIDEALDESAVMSLISVFCVPRPSQLEKLQVILLKHCPAGKSGRNNISLSCNSAAMDTTTRFLKMIWSMVYLKEMLSQSPVIMS